MIKSFADLEQSKKLAEILPLESADMTYSALVEGMRDKMSIKGWKVNVGLDIAIKENLFSYRNGYMFPCWSLAALLGVLPAGKSLIHGENTHKYKLINCLVDAEWHDNPVDACYEIILKLNEQNIL